MAESPDSRFRVGYALAVKKQHSFIQPSLVALAATRGVDLVPIDPSLPISDQGPFHCVIHKLYTDDWKSNLNRYSLSHPDVPVIDPPDAIERLHNRISMLQVVSDLRIPLANDTFGIPKQVVVYDSESLASLADSSAVASLRFPVIAKPLVADGSAKSHKMALVFHLDGLSKLRPPIVLQEFVNHGGVIFKVYVVGDYVKCVKRKSLPDISKEKLECSEGSLPFSQVSNMTTQDQTEKEYYETMHLEEAEMPPASFVVEIARGLRQAMGLQLFNFDMIRDTEAVNHYLVIDINYFPGYAKMPGYETVLTDFFWDLVHKKKEDGGLGPAIDDGGDERKKLVGNHDKMGEGTVK